MNLTQLRYFYESAKNENFSKTAELYNVPTTSVSASIKRLEQELGNQLFDRNSNRIRLNARGQLLQQALHSAFHDINQAVAQISDQAQDDRQIKILVRGMRRKVMDILVQYSALHPNVAFQISFDHGDNHIQDYDIVIDDEKAQYGGYERIELFHMHLRLKCAPNHPLRGKQMTLSQLADQPFASMNPDSNLHKILINACSRAGFSPRICFICNDIECYEKFIAAGMGIGVNRLDDSDSSHPLCNLDVIDFDPTYTVYAYYAQDEFYGNVQSFVNFLKTQGI